MITHDVIDVAFFRKYHCIWEYRYYVQITYTIIYQSDISDIIKRR